MCKHGDTVEIQVIVPADLSNTGWAEWKAKPIDRCIVDIVRALQGYHIHMRSSCCGHGKGDGKIELQDGRVLIIRAKEANHE